MIAGGGGGDFVGLGLGASCTGFVPPCPSLTGAAATENPDLVAVKEVVRMVGPGLDFAVAVSAAGKLTGYSAARRVSPTVGCYH
ncbi:hypothetical protein HDU96_001329, partial [Phlyctochytrium bullatum]